MFTRLLIDGALKIVHVISYKNKKRIARIYGLNKTIPEAVLFEIENDKFLDTISDKGYRLTPTGMAGL